MKNATDKEKEKYKEMVEKVIDACICGADGMHGVLLIGNESGMMTVLSINSTRQDATLLVNAAYEAMQDAPENLGAYN